MEFKIGQLVMHCRDGLLSIVSKTDINGKSYFVAASKEREGEKIYIPEENANSIIRPIMSKNEADIKLKEAKLIEFDYIVNAKQRRDLYKRKLSSGRIEDIIWLYRIYELIKKYHQDIKLGNIDIDIFEFATKFFLDEMALCFSIERHLVAEFISQRIESL